MKAWQCLGILLVIGACKEESPPAPSASSNDASTPTGAGASTDAASSADAASLGDATRLTDATSRDRTIAPPSGLAIDLPLRGITQADRETLCRWADQVIGTEPVWCQEPCRNGACPEAIQVTPLSFQACVEQLRTLQTDCAATVGDYERCIQTIAIDICESLGVVPECEAVDDCLTG
jgi:hypothetical protein